MKPRYWDVRRAVRRSLTPVSYEQLEAAYLDSSVSGLDLWGLDKSYKAVDRLAWDLILAYSQVDKKKYKADTFDCDNFAVSLAGTVTMKWGLNGIGIILDFSGGHAYSALLVQDEDEGLYIAVVEPQTDEFVITGKGMYKAEQGIIVFF